MGTYIVGLGLMVAGAVLFLVGKLRTKRATVHASKGSVAVGGDNAGQITNVNVGSHNKKSAGESGLTLTAIVVEIIGIIVTIWHALHLAAK
jgi:hypothetical protein